MPLRPKFEGQLAKVKKSHDKFEKAQHELHVREVGYKDEGIDFSANIQAKLSNSIGHWERVRSNQSQELLKMHDRMIEAGEPVDPTFDRKAFEKYVR